ncbi:related to Staphylococcus multidrug resistance protein [Rhynchosporium secalis]|uniref:Related to Staphylococcus multidrug resistance protein n=1 Tax=Rhynchosporium secalis TaxID=38038 RepID=A0A1E1MB75_RHYSE|nr:related to Staphylococcus multidrug resistance protein [Rhynchosporium secalis]
MFAYGGTTLVLVLYLSALGVPDTKIGLFMTLTLVGDIGVSTVLTVVGNGMGVRTTMVTGALLMVGGGITFAVLENYWVLLAASVLGVINPSANEIDPFKAIEESAIARLSTPETRNDFFAWWTLLGMIGMAASTLFTGFAVDVLKGDYGLQALDIYRLIFLGYAAVGFLKLICALCISSQAELQASSALLDDSEVESIDTSHPLLSEHQCQHQDGPYGTASYPRGNDISPSHSDPDLAPMFTPDSRSFIWKLSLAMIPDYIGSGLAQITWMTYFFKRKYNIDEGPLGLAIFIASIISSFLNLLSSPLSRALGQVPTMVICHTITSISLLMITAPSNRTLALGLFMLRIVLREIDAAPRQSFTTGGVLDEERTSAMGLVMVVKTVGCCAGLFLTGEFAGSGYFWVAFIVAGGLKLLHNVVIVAFFWNQKGRHEI